MTTIDDPARLDDFPASPAGFPIFDGHNDALLALDLDPRRPASLLERGTSGHLDLPRAREGGFAGGMFAVFVPSGRRIRPPRGGVPDRYELPMPRPLGLVRAQRVAGRLAAALFRAERQSGGRLEVIRSAGQLKSCLKRDVLAAPGVRRHGGRQLRGQHAAARRQA